jgi:hypothetical protein
MKWKVKYLKRITHYTIALEVLAFEETQHTLLTGLPTYVS